MPYLSVAIPSCCQSPGDIRIGYVLNALALESEYRFLEQLRITIWDEGPVPIVSDRSVQLMIDLLVRRGHGVNYLRRQPSQGIAMARQGLLTESLTESNGMVLMLDDDLVVEHGAIDRMMEAAHKFPDFGFLQGTKIEVDPQRVYHNDINMLNKAQASPDDYPPLYFGDAAFLLVRGQAVKSVRWDIITRYREQDMAGEDVAFSLMIADKFTCHGVSRALGYHLSLAHPRWKWEASSDALQVELLREVVRPATLAAALPHLAYAIDAAER